MSNTILSGSREPHQSPILLDPQRPLSPAQTALTALGIVSAFIPLFGYGWQAMTQDPETHFRHELGKRINRRKSDEANLALILQLAGHARLPLPAHHPALCAGREAEARPLRQRPALAADDDRTPVGGRADAHSRARAQGLPVPVVGRQVALLHELDEAAHLADTEAAVRIEGVEPHLPFSHSGSRGTSAPERSASPTMKVGCKYDALVVAGGSGSGATPVVGAKGPLGANALLLPIPFEDPVRLGQGVDEAVVLLWRSSGVPGCPWRAR